MAAPLGTVEIPVFIRFDGLERQVGMIELDVMGEVTPQVKNVERAIAHALAPSEAQEEHEPDDGPGRAWAPIDLLRGGLLIIATRSCEATRQGDCWSLGRTADARYGADLACASCIAVKVLAGEELPTGPGEHANEGVVTFAAHLGDGSEDYH